VVRGQFDIEGERGGKVGERKTVEDSLEREKRERGGRWERGERTWMRRECNNFRKDVT